MELNEEFLSVVADRKALDELEEVEIIFQPIAKLGGFDNCSQLRQLSIISTGLKEISNLEPLAPTLVELCLTDQQLTRISGLNLPNLRRLFLHRNKIKKIENLDGCPRLESLWLSSNQISKIENLQNLDSLKELWLQDNKIKKLENFEYLANLSCLALAGNPLCAFENIQDIAQLSHLQDLSFADSVFRSCPVTEAEGYRAFVLCTVMHLEVLDDRPVTGEESQASRDLQRHLLQEFNQRIQIASDEAEREIHQIRAHRARQKNSAREMNKMLMESFNELEACIMAGRRRVQESLDNDIKVRKKAQSALEEALRKLQNDFESDLDVMKKQEETRFKRIEAMLEATKKRSQMEHHLSKSLTRLPTRGCIATLLQSNSAELRTLSKALHAATGSKGGGGLRVLRGYTLFSENKVRFFRQRVESSIRTNSQGDIRVVYAALPLALTSDDNGQDHLHDAIADNLIVSGRDEAAGPLMLYADPIKAFRETLSSALESDYAYAVVIECQLFVHADTHVLLPDQPQNLSAEAAAASFKSGKITAQFQHSDDASPRAQTIPAEIESITALPHDPNTVYAVQADTTSRAHLLLNACLLCEATVSSITAPTGQGSPTRSGPSFTCPRRVAAICAHAECLERSRTWQRL